MLDQTAFFLSGELVEADEIMNIFGRPKDRRTEDYSPAVRVPVRRREGEHGAVVAKCVTVWPCVFLSAEEKENMELPWQNV